MKSCCKLPQNSSITASFDTLSRARKATQGPFFHQGGALRGLAGFPRLHLTWHTICLGSMKALDGTSPTSQCYINLGPWMQSFAKDSISEG